MEQFPNFVVTKSRFFMTPYVKFYLDYLCELAKT